MEIKVSKRKVYHAYAEIIVEIPDEVQDVAEYLQNETDYELELAQELFFQPRNKGLGLREGMNEPESEDETRFDVVGQDIGGHL